MTSRELDEIMIGRWPTVIRRAMVDGDEWTRNFVRSIARAYKRPGWMPSPRQEYFMRALLREMQAPAEADLFIDEEEENDTAA